jgi:hypothetical protein
MAIFEAKPVFHHHFIRLWQTSEGQLKHPLKKKKKRNRKKKTLCRYSSLSIEQVSTRGKTKPVFQLCDWPYPSNVASFGNLWSAGRGESMLSRISEMVMELVLHLDYFTYSCNH